jgi:uncharacterized protein YeaO (DUF488 family)
MIQLKRAYDKPDSQDGFRVLVEPYWPRDLAEKDAKFDQWLKEVAPSAELHQHFGQHPNIAKWAEFERCYRAELQGKHSSIDFLHKKRKEGVLTLIHAAHDEDHSSASVLKRFLEESATSSDSK